VTLTRRQRWSLIAFLVALAALALDKLLLSSAPAAALAGVSHNLGGIDAGQSIHRIGSAGPTSAVDNALATAERILLHKRHLSENAGGIAAAISKVGDATPDVFNWNRIFGTNAANGISDDRSGVRRTTANAFRESHQLTATLLGPQPVALIGGNMYRVGDVLDGFTLDAVRAGEAVFVSDGVNIILRVPTPWREGRSTNP
jgi:hypothetical protein